MAADNAFRIPNITGISCHAWNADKTKVALCPNDETIHIYGKANDADTKNWVLEHVLVEHDLLVSGLDWSPVTNKIVSCSHDRNAFVWTLKDGKWEPSLVILRIDRAATDVKWSPNGLKFAVASGSKQVPVCHYEETPNWWISKMIKKHHSTVLSVAWHPNSQLLATACADYKCRVFSAFIEGEVDKSFDCGPLSTAESAFGEVLCEFDSCDGWVEAVTWSPKGTKLAFVGHDSTVNIVQFNEATPSEPPTIQCLKFGKLPFTCLAFLSESHIVAGGHDYNPAVFKTDAGGFWTFVGFADQKEEKAAGAKVAGFTDRKKMFEDKSSKGADAAGAEVFETKHQALITGVTVLGPKTFTTSALDAKLIKWDLAKVKGLDL